MHGWVILNLDFHKLFGYRSSKCIKTVTIFGLLLKVAEGDIPLNAAKGYCVFTYCLCTSHSWCYKDCNLGHAGLLLPLIVQRGDINIQRTWSNNAPTTFKSTLWNSSWCNYQVFPFSLNSVLMPGWFFYNFQSFQSFLLLAWCSRSCCNQLTKFWIPKFIFGS